MTYSEITLIIVTFLQALPKILAAVASLIAAKRQQQDKRPPSKDL